MNDPTLFNNHSNPEPVAIEINGVIDLHTFQPRDAADVVIDYLEACLEKGIYQIRIIHGKGTGTLRRIVHSALEKHSAVQSYRLAGEDGGSWGATLVDLRTNRAQRLQSGVGEKDHEL